LDNNPNRLGCAGRIFREFIAHLARELQPRLNKFLQLFELELKRILAQQGAVRSRLRCGLPGYKNFQVSVAEPATDRHRG
jgi:hypothetical protein